MKDRNNNELQCQKLLAEEEDKSYSQNKSLKTEESNPNKRTQEQKLLKDKYGFLFYEELPPLTLLVAHQLCRDNIDLENSTPKTIESTLRDKFVEVKAEDDKSFFSLFKNKKTIAKLDIADFRKQQYEINVSAKTKPSNLIKLLQEQNLQEDIKQYFKEKELSFIELKSHESSSYIVKEHGAVIGIFNININTNQDLKNFDYISIDENRSKTFSRLVLKDAENAKNIEFLNMSIAIQECARANTETLNYKGFLFTKGEFMNMINKDTIPLEFVHNESVQKPGAVITSGDFMKTQNDNKGQTQI